MEKDNSLKNFFKFLGAGFFISSFRSSLLDLPIGDIIRRSAFDNIYNFMTNIPTSLLFMAIVDIYSGLKKNIKNEGYRNKYWGINRIRFHYY